MTGIELIAEERHEQKVKHKYSIKKDADYYPDFELAHFAEAILSGRQSNLPPCFRESFDNIMDKPYQDRLVIAGALIAAEIDRLNFKE